MPDIEIFRPPLVEKIKNLTRDEIKEMALNFVTSEMPALDRALLVYILEKLVDDIKKMDKGVYDRVLKEFYEKNKNGTTPPQLGDFQVVAREITTKVYLDNEKANKIKEQIENLKKELESLEYYEQPVRKTYFIKHKGDR